MVKRWEVTPRSLLQSQCVCALNEVKESLHRRLDKMAEDDIYRSREKYDKLYEKLTKVKFDKPV